MFCELIVRADSTKYAENSLPRNSLIFEKKSVYGILKEGLYPEVEAFLQENQQFHFPECPYVLKASID